MLYQSKKKILAYLRQDGKTVAFGSKDIGVKLNIDHNIVCRVIKDLEKEDIIKIDGFSAGVDRYTTGVYGHTLPHGIYKESNTERLINYFAALNPMAEIIKAVIVAFVTLLFSQGSCKALHTDKEPKSTGSSKTVLQPKDDSL